MNAPFRWLSPTGLVHAGRILEMQSVCGVKVRPIGSGWQAVDHGFQVTCFNCLQVTEEVLVRPSFVSIDARGARTVRV